MVGSVGCSHHHGWDTKIKGVEFHLPLQGRAPGDPAVPPSPASQWFHPLPVLLQTGDQDFST